MIRLNVMYTVASITITLRATDSHATESLVEEVNRAIDRERDRHARIMSGRPLPGDIPDHDACPTCGAE